ncbi:MAG: hypothetical protein VKN13_04030 [Cyanobacteriota bacterium]|nr:hypothetical protein [Cyanobacteriota bacterium]
MAPLFLLRDGRKRELPLKPDEILCLTYRDGSCRPVHVLLDSASERRLLAAQPRRRRRSGARQRGPRAAEAA